MKNNRISLVILLAQLAILLSSAHAMNSPQVFAAPAATNAVTEIITPLPTNTPDVPMPTETMIPAFPTPSRIDFAVQNASLQAKIVGVEKPYRIHLGVDSKLGTDIVYNPGPGNMFLGLGIKVANFTGSDIRMKWSSLYLVNKYQEKWYPVWGVYKKINTAMDPLTLEILQADQVHPDFDPNAYFNLSHNGYLRLIFQLPRDNLYYYFGFSDLPQIEINWRYY